LIEKDEREKKCALCDFEARERERASLAGELAGANAALVRQKHPRVSNADHSNQSLHQSLPLLLIDPPLSQPHGASDDDETMSARRFSTPRVTEDPSSFRTPSPAGGQGQEQHTHHQQEHQHPREAAPAAGAADADADADADANADADTDANADADADADAAKAAAASARLVRLRHRLQRRLHRYQAAGCPPAQARQRARDEGGDEGDAAALRALVDGLADDSWRHEAPRHSLPPAAAPPPAAAAAALR